MDDCTFSLPRFEKRVPVATDTLSEFDVPYWEHIPEHDRGTEVYKSFVYGYAEVVKAMCNVIMRKAVSRAISLPTRAAVLKKVHTRQYDQRHLDFFFRQGGVVDFAIDGMLDEVRDSDYFFDTIAEDYDEYLKDEYEAIPKHPFDEEWSFVRTMILGPSSICR
jgi:hypothetical protein